MLSQVPEVTERDSCSDNESHAYWNTSVRSFLLLSVKQTVDCIIVSLSGSTQTLSESPIWAQCLDKQMRRDANLQAGKEMKSGVLSVTMQAKQVIDLFFYDMYVQDVVFISVIP